MSTMLPLLLVLALNPAPEAPPASGSSLHIVAGVTDSGEATDQWRAMLRKRLRDEAFENVAFIRRPLTDAEHAWSRLIHARVPLWQHATPELAQWFAPVPPPAAVAIVVGNRGAEDAFTHDPTTIGFDVAALRLAYGEADLPENAARLAAAARLCGPG